MPVTNLLSENTSRQVSAIGNWTTEVGLLNRNEDIISRAEMLLRAKSYSGTGNWLDETGNGHDATNNGALFKEPENGMQYLYLPGSSGNYAVVADAASLDITGDIDIRVALRNPTFGTNNALVYKHSSNDTLSTNSYGLRSVNATTLSLSWRTGGGSAIGVNDGGTLPDLSSYSFAEVRATLDVSSGQVEFYYRTSDGGSWINYASPAAVGATDINSSSTSVGIGAIDTGATWNFAGDMYRAQIYDGIDGTLVLNADFTSSAWTEPFASALDGTGSHTITINRTTTGYASTIVDQAMWLLDGGTNHLLVANSADLNFASGQDFTVVVIARSHDSTTGSHNGLISKYTASLASNPGWELAWANYGAQFQVSDGTNTPVDINAATPADVSTAVLAGRRIAGSEIETFVDGVGTGSPDTDTSIDLSTSGDIRGRFWELLSSERPSPTLRSPQSKQSSPTRTWVCRRPFRSALATARSSPRLTRGSLRTR